ncbi:MAG: fumarate hydratase C-terminal domain-containing protein [Lachnospiraceae bacterium]|nr:fumarate hydratase C-terminal domain-containing protein [Lachnospiraceae bacterium]
MKQIQVPISREVAASLQVGDRCSLSGKIYCGRDAVLPKICKLIEEGRLGEYEIDLQGGVIFHTAVSIAGVGPTSSNKPEIEGSFELLSKAGVRMQLGKGAISQETINMLESYDTVFAIIPPVTALLGENTISQKCVAFPELGIEAFYEIQVKDYPIVIGAAHGKSIY